MNDEMQKQILTRLDALTSKLGTGVTQLYSLYLRQVYINGLEELVVASISGYLTFKIIRYFRQEFDKEDFDVDLRKTGFCILYVITGAVSLFYFIAALDCFSNPKLAAFELLIDKIK